MRTIIIDDEENCIGTLEILLGQYAPDVEILATCKSGKEGLEAIEKYNPDFIFLDIAMPRMNGFDMLSKVKNPDFEIVFTTAYDAYAFKAFKVSAIDYLLKPIDKEELLNAIEKVKVKRHLKNNSQAGQTYPQQWELFLENIRTQNNLFPNIALPTSEGIEMVKAMDIIVAEADGNYSKLMMRDGRNILLSRTLREMEDTLNGHHFVRVHHSHLVNKAEIKKYVKGEGGYVILQNGQHVNVSRRRKPDLLKALKQN